MGHITIKIAEERTLQIACREGSSDRSVVHQIWHSRHYDLRRLSRWAEIRESYQSILSSGKRPLILDCGANIGASALFFSELYQGCEVLAVEPEPGNYALLRQNAQQAQNIHCVQGAVASSDGASRIFDPGISAWGFRTARLDGPPPDAEAGTCHAVPAYSIRSLLRMAPSGSVPFFIKIDIEGGELDLFSKNTGWIDLFHVLAIELHDWLLPGQATSKNFLTAIAPLGRDFVYIGENIFSIRN